MKKISTLIFLLFLKLQVNACDAAFSFTVDGFIIHLNGAASTGDVSSWHWYIDGDLFSDSGPETNTTVDSAGEYEICLVTETASGCIDTVCQTIHVEQSNDCEASFSYTVDGFIIHLNGSASTGDVSSWHWYINGDLFSDAGPETNTTVDSAGEYQICLITETASGCIDTVCQTVHVEQSNDCQASFSYTVDGFIIHLNGAASTGDVSSWHWYIDGDLFSDAGPETNTTVDSAGEYQICLITETAAGCIDTVCQTVHVEQSNDCEASFSFTVDGFTIHLNGSTSTGDVSSWHWYIDGDLFSDSGPETNTTVDSAGEYQICLITETASGCIDTVCQTIHVEQSNDCEASFSYTVDGFTIHLNGSASTGDVSSWRWYIDGDLFSDAGPETNTTVDSAGEYQICLITETASGCIDTVCQTVHVEQSNNCEASFSYAVDGFIIHLNGSASTGDVSSWHWYIDGDLFSDAGPETNTTVGDMGEYEICLVIETAAGCTDTSCADISVEGPQDDGYNFKVLSPASDGSIVILLTSQYNGSYTLNLTEMTGKKVLEQSVPMSVGTTKFVITPGKTLPTGYYLISINFNNEVTKIAKAMILK